MKLSYSSISLYTECPAKFKFKYIDRIPEQSKHYFSFGSSVHNALEYFYASNPSDIPSVAQVLKYYHENWINKGYKDKAQESQYLKEGEVIIQNFYNKHILNFKPCYFTEYRFDMTINGVPIMGYIDRIDKSGPNGIDVIDYKTGTKFSEDRVKTDEQLTLYQIACEDLLGLSINSLTLYHLNSLTSFSATPRTSEELSRFKNKVVEVANSINSGHFDPKPEEWKCSRCDFKSRCPAFKDQYLTLQK